MSVRHFQSFRWQLTLAGMTGLLLGLVLLVCNAPAIAQLSDRPSEGRLSAIANTPAVPIETKAKFAVILDHDTGNILYARNATQPTAPASMSKLMTAAITFEKLKAGEIDLQTPFSVSRKAWQWQGSKMWVLVDTKISVENLLRGLIIQSGNDAAIVLAENIAGSEEGFAVLMNRKAREWGLVDSHFANATGWPDPGQRMSMIDLARLAQKIIRDYSEYYPIFSEKSFTWSKIEQSNRNPLLGAFEGADGLKTGHTDEAGYGVVGSALQDGQRRIVVLQGLESGPARLREARRMMAIAFNDFSARTYFRPNEPLVEATVFKGKQKTVALGLKEEVRIMAHRKLANDIKARAFYEGPVAAPILDNQQIGYLRVEIPGQPYRDYPLFAQSAVGEIGWVGKIGLAAQKLLIKPETEPQVNSNPAQRVSR